MPPSISISQQIKQLRKEIEEHNYRYYVLDAPVISDADYDTLFKKLQELERQHPDYITMDSPTQRVGATPLAQFATVQPIRKCVIGLIRASTIL